MMTAQRPAPKTSRFPHTVIRASAGSGKTFQLTNRYLGLLLDGVPPEKILAVTFTRKAAGEILDRILLRLAEAAANDAKLNETLNAFPNAKVATRQKFIDNQISGLSSVLNILYVLLALSVIVSLFGIVNTLVLTVFERTREIGMLRAIGMTRRQVRRMIRYESVITALIGAAIGIVLGIVLAGLLIARIDFIVLSVPVGQLVIFAVAAIFVGIIAAIFPARRAARLNVLNALQYE